MIAYSFACKHSRKRRCRFLLDILPACHPAPVTPHIQDACPHWSTDPGRGAKGLGRVVGSWAQRCNKVVVTVAVSG